MRLSEFLRLAIPSVGVACFIVGILAIVYLAYIFKSKKYQQTPLDIKKLIYRGLLIGYILVVIIATLGRPSYSFDMKASTELFSSYRLAINHFDMREWRNIILNICVYTFRILITACIFKNEALVDDLHSWNPFDTVY